MKSICIVSKKKSAVLAPCIFHDPALPMGLAFIRVFSIWIFTIWAFMVWMFIAFFPGRVFAFTEEGFPGKDPGQVAWELSAQTIEYDEEKQVYIATGDVVITGGATRLEADFAQYSDLTKDAVARGNVTLISGEDVLSCDALKINLLTEQGVVENGSLFLQKNHLYFEAETIKKTGEFTYRAEKGSITSCKGKVPDWKITGKNIRVTVEGYGLVSHAAFRIKDVPALYTPFMVFPVKNRRQTGLLAPMISLSDRQGFSFDQPFFLALSRSTDLTFSGHYMSDRGVKAGTRFRYVRDPSSKGTVFFDFLKDRKVDDGSAGSKDYGFSSTPQRFNHDRYWFRMKADQNFPLGIKALVDLDIVSDADYLRDFRRGHTGYDRGQAYFYDEFGRGMDAYSDTVRKNTLTLYRNQGKFAFSAQAVWYDDVIARRHSDRDMTLQTLPALCFDIAKTPLHNTGLYYDLDTEFRSFYRKDTSAENFRSCKQGQRVDAASRIYYPMRVNKSFFVEPFLGIRTTAWHAKDFVSRSGEKDSVMTRVLPQGGAVLSTTVSRVFAVNKAFAQKIRHKITPCITYEYIPKTDQDDLPLFDSVERLELDRLENQSTIGWSLTQTFTAKKVLENKDGKKPVYYDLAWMKLSQDYHFSGYGNFLDTKDRHRDRAWSDLFLEAQVYPSFVLDFFGFVGLDADVSLCPYTGQFRKINLGTNWKNQRGDFFVSEYRYAAQESVSLETWYNEVHVKVNRNLELYGVLEQDLYAGKIVEVKAGISLNRPCWTLTLTLGDTSGDKRIGFLVNLSGLGQWGSN